MANVNPFSPILLGPRSLPSRIVVLAVTHRPGAGNMSQPVTLARAQRRGCGLIIAEGAQLTEAGVGYPATFQGRAEDGSTAATSFLSR